MYRTVSTGYTLSVILFLMIDTPFCTCTCIQNQRRKRRLQVITGVKVLIDNRSDYFEPSCDKGDIYYATQ